MRYTFLVIGKHAPITSTQRRFFMQINGIDGKDNQIVNILLEDGRMSFTDVGEKVGLSRTAVKNRVAALEESGIIKGFRAVINPLETPEMMTFVVNIETKAEHFEAAKVAFVEAPETVTLVHTTGTCHLLAICVSQDVKTMRVFVNKLYKEVPGIVSINAHSIMEVIKGSVIPEK